MKRQLRILAVATAALGVLTIAACQGDPVAPGPEGVAVVSADRTGPTTAAACWGQATKVFARMGAMGQHASQQPTPRVGLRNLARALYDAGIIPDDSMAALGSFVAAELGLSIEACM